jgi:ATP-dependent Clp protease ATP-binding subunit ClpA
MFERFSDQARRAIFFARYEASQYGSPFIETEHLLLGLVRVDKALAKAFSERGDGSAEIRAEIEQHIRRGERISTSVELPLSERSAKVLKLAVEESDRVGHRHIGPDHLLLGLLGVEGSLAARLLQARGLTVAAVRDRLAPPSRRSSVAIDEPHVDEAKLMLDSFLSGLKSRKAEESIEFFAHNGQFIDVSGRRWNRQEISKNFEMLFAPYAKKNAAFVIEETVVDESGLFIASVLWKNAILASMKRIWLHRMSVVAIGESEDWSILLIHATAIQPQ